MIGAVLGDIAGSKWEFDVAKKYYNKYCNVKENIDVTKYI